MPDPMLEQHTSQILFEKLVAGQFCSGTASNEKINVKQLTDDEENILRYVAGYVLSKLMNRFEEQSSRRATGMLECLPHMSVGSSWNKSIEVDCFMLVTYVHLNLSP